MLGALLGGLAGILFPTAGAAASGAAATGIGALLGRAALPALGAGLGTLATGGNGKDAIRNALMFGAGAAAFPGAAEALRGSQFGQGITGGMEALLGLGGQEQGQGAASPTVSSASMRPQPRPDGFGSMVQPPMAELPSMGRSDMEADARDRNRMTTMPSLREMAALDEARKQRRAAAGFDIAQMYPIPPVSDPSFAGASGFEDRIGDPFDMTVYPDVPVGMDMLSDIVDTSRQRYMESEPRSLAAQQAATDYLLANRQGARLRPESLTYDPSRFRYAEGGAVEGPGTGTSDSIPAEIYQDGKPVTKAEISDGEFVMTARAVKGAGNGNRERGISRMYELMRRFESGEMV